MKALKLIKFKSEEDPYNRKRLEGRLIVRVGYDTILVATPTESQCWIDSYTEGAYKIQFETEEVELESEWKFIPHWAKVIKQQVEKEKI
jgi:hypothetical protein